MRNFTFRACIAEDHGAVISAELFLLATAVLIATIIALTSARDSVISELSDVAGSIQDTNQTITYNGVSSASGSSPGSNFLDALDAGDSVDDVAGQADNCITFDLAPTTEFTSLEIYNANFDEAVEPNESVRKFGSSPAAFLFNASDVAGWNTTAADQQIEIWESGFNGVAAQSGGYFAEINANQSAQLFQEFQVAPGDRVQYSIWHRGRSGVDVANVMIGGLGSQVSHQTLSTGNQAWANYSGTYVVPNGITTLRIGFESVSSANGNNSFGNFIDNLQVQICN